MLLFIAGAMTTGAVVAMTVVVSISSAMPPAIFPMMLAVAGAMTNTSAHWARAMCSTLNSGISLNMDTATGLPEISRIVSGVINSVACSVIMHLTSAPRLRSMLAISAALNAAMPPLMAKTIFLFSNNMAMISSAII